MGERKPLACKENAFFIVEMLAAFSGNKFLREKKDRTFSGNKFLMEKKDRKIGS